MAEVGTLLRLHAGGAALELEPKNVVRANSLEIGHAARYVVIARGDFTLAKEMLADNPDFKQGRA